MRFFFSIFKASTLFVFFISSVFAQPAPDIAQANNKFAFDLYSRLDSKKGNLLFSPYSLSSALTMTYEGAHGQTADEMRESLYLPSDETDWRADATSFIQRMNASHQSYELSTANALWAQQKYPFKETYLKIVRSTYLAEARNLDFIANPEASRVTINDWVSNHTQKRINDLLPPSSISSSVRLVLTNAVYFKGKWETPFNKQVTKLDTFWLTPDHAVQTQMMKLGGSSFNYTENDQAQVIQIPYQGNFLSMIIVLPRSKDIQSLEKIFNWEIFKQWQAAMLSQETNIAIPKFKFDWQLDVSEPLKDLGIKQAFDSNRADFSGMAEKVLNENLSISEVIHKAWIETNEEGSEAAAATAVALIAGVAYNPQGPKVFHADHPFIFMIQDNKTGHILFMGRVSDPREK